MKHELAELIERNTILSFNNGKDISINIPDYTACVNNCDLINSSSLEFRPSHPGISAFGHNLDATRSGTLSNLAFDFSNQRKLPFIVLHPSMTNFCSYGFYI